MCNWSACLDEDLSLFQWLEACRLNRPSPELRRENSPAETEQPVVAFSNPQADTEKPQETCGSRRQRRRRHVRLEDRLEQRWEPGTQLSLGSHRMPSDRADRSDLSRVHSHEFTRRAELAADHRAESGARARSGNLRETERAKPSCNLAQRFRKHLIERLAPGFSKSDIFDRLYLRPT